MYRVLIVEDDPMVASIDRSYVERTADFTVVAVCKNGVEALELFKTEEIRSCRAGLLYARYERR